MTITRSIAIICLSFLLLPQLAGQQEDSSGDILQLSDSQIFEIESMAPDSAGDDPIDGGAIPGGPAAARRGHHRPPDR